MAALGGPGSCPPGYYWNPDTSQCESILGVGIPPIFLYEGAPPQCQNGYYYDPINNVCLPNPVVVIPPPPPPLPPTPPARAPTPKPPTAKPPSGFTERTPPTGTAAPWPPTGPINVWLPPTFGTPPPPPSVTETGGTTVVPTGPLSGVVVNVDQSVSLADNSASNAVQNVADAVYAALQQAATLASSGTSGVVGDITGALQSLTTSIDQGVTTTFGSIAQVLQQIETGIGTNLGGIGTTIGNEIANSLNPAVIALTGIAAEIAKQIGGLGGQIAAAVAAIIPQILAAISNPIGAITGVLGQIEQVLTGQIAGITTQVGSIATTLGGLGTTLDGVLLHYEAWAAPFVEAQTGYPDGGSLHHDLSQIVAAIAGTLEGLAPSADVKLSDILQPPCAGTFIQQQLDTGLFGDQAAPGIANDIGRGLAFVVGWVFKALGLLRIVGELGTQHANQDCPSDLLPLTALVDGVRRGFLSQSDASLEALKQGIDGSRFKTLYDLAAHQFTPNEIAEAFYRKIISLSDYQAALASQGFDPGQMDTLQALSVNRPTLEILWELRRRQLIDDSSLKTALAVLQYDSAQQDALTTLTFRPPNVQEAIDGTASQAALSQLGLGGLANSDTVPEYVSVAGQNEGLDAESTALRWASHWNVGSIGSYITLYFRGLISIDTLNAVMAKNYIPQELVTTLVTAARPLIQYRTISNMLRIGQLDVQTAGTMLMQHGYTAQDAQLLINYAQRPGTPVKTKQAQQLHAVSLGIAKREFIDGAITENDYYQILLAHGYTIEGANAEIAVEKANQAMIVRKENAQLVVDEYGAGLIDEQTALAQLAVLGLTVYEIAKYTHKIRAFRVKAAKHPSEAELNDFRKNGIISDQMYVQQLQLIGYSSQVAGWFDQWRTLTGSTSGASASVAPPPPAGG